MNCPFKLWTFDKEIEYPNNESVYFDFIDGPADWMTENIDFGLMQ